MRGVAQVEAPARTGVVQRRVLQGRVRFPAAESLIAGSGGASVSYGVDGLVLGDQRGQSGALRLTFVSGRGDQVEALIVARRAAANHPMALMELGVNRVRVGLRTVLGARGDHDAVDLDGRGNLYGGLGDARSVHIALGNVDAAGQRVLEHHAELPGERPVGARLGRVRQLGHGRVTAALKRCGNAVCVLCSAQAIRDRRGGIQRGIAGRGSHVHPLRHGIAVIILFARVNLKLHDAARGGEPIGKLRINVARRAVVLGHRRLIHGYLNVHQLVKIGELVQHHRTHIGLRVRAVQRYRTARNHVLDHIAAQVAQRRGCVLREVAVAMVDRPLLLAEGSLCQTEAVGELLGLRPRVVVKATLAEIHGGLNVEVDGVVFLLAIRVREVRDVRGIGNGNQHRMALGTIRLHLVNGRELLVDSEGDLAVLTTRRIRDALGPIPQDLLHIIEGIHVDAAQRIVV